MKTLLALFAITLAVSTPVSGETVPILASTPVTANAPAVRLSGYASTSWRTVVYDDFEGSTLPSHWGTYNGRTTRNCFRTSHATVSGGYLHLKMFHEPSGNCGPGWYSGGVTLTKSLSAPNQRVTVRFRITNINGIIGRRVVPMLNPDDGSHIGEQDLCESAGTLAWCSTFLHYGAPGTTQVQKKYLLDLTQWHTMQFTMNGNRVLVVIDGVTRWDYTGNATTLPRKLRHVVMQQDCVPEGCPTTHVGQEDIQVDWIRVENGN